MLLLPSYDNSAATNAHANVIDMTTIVDTAAATTKEMTRRRYHCMYNKWFDVVLLFLVLVVAPVATFLMFGNSPQC